jgi:FkbM family methyltransferase
MLKRVMEAIEALVSARADERLGSSDEISPLQVYLGYHTEDLELVARAVCATASLEADHYIDGFGVKTLYSCVPFASQDSLDVSRLQFPIPDDGLHAEGIEYASLLDAIERFAGNGKFVAVEAGAGWGPWLAMAGVVCKGMGVDTIRLVGAEASESRFALMQDHLDFNGLGSDSGIQVDLFRGAVWSYDGKIYFPDSEVEDMGVAASSRAGPTDYRGRSVVSIETPCSRLDTLLGQGSEVDFLHMDVQGAEMELMSSHKSWLDAFVKSMFIATHSRPLEGELLDLLSASNWRLLREKPCRFELGGSMPSWVGATTADGSQYWVNGKFT